MTNMRIDENTPFYKQLGDRSGIPYDSIDESVGDLVCILNHLGLPTGASCEGHLNREHVHCHPWVKFHQCDCGFLNPLLDRYNEGQKNQLGTVRKAIWQSTRTVDIQRKMFQM